VLAHARRRQATADETKERTMTDVDTSVETVVDTYLAMWNEQDAGERARHITQAWAADGHYVDPLLEARGHGELSDMVATVHGHYPGHVFRRTSGVDAHHDQARFGWELVAPDGTTTVAGIDVATIAGDGRLQRVTGFFGDLPQ
jgi:hypothetical protein